MIISACPPIPRAGSSRRRDTPEPTDSYRPSWQEEREKLRPAFLSAGRLATCAAGGVLGVALTRVPDPTARVAGMLCVGICGVCALLEIH